MNILKREAAPLTKKAWQEIDETAVDVIKNMTTTRMIFNINGPKGWGFNVVDEGRLESVQDESDSVVSAGYYKVLPLCEARVDFNLDRWEMDNISRDAKDPELDPLEDAVRDLVLFEENAIYNGYANANIKGLEEVAENVIAFPKAFNEILRVISEAKYTMMDNYVAGPYTLVVSSEVYDRLNIMNEGQSLYLLVEKLIGGRIIRSKAVKGAFLLKEDFKDFELTVGHDYSIGYVKDEGDNVQLFASVSFAFRVLDPAGYVKFTV